MDSDHDSMPLHSELSRRCPRTIAVASIFFLLLLTAAAQPPAKKPAVSIGGEPVVTLKRPQSADKSVPQFLELVELPGRGMAWLQIRAYVPGKGIINVLNAPPLGEAATLLDKKDDEWGNGVFKIGGAILLPYANRIRGKLSPDGKTITAIVAGRTLNLPANWHGNNPGAEVHSIHGLMQRAKFQDVKQTTEKDAAKVSAVLHAGNFGGHWVSDTDVTVESTLKNDSLELSVTAKNVGKEPMPMGIGWHPNFVIPSGNRKQALLLIPSETRAVMNNYDDTFTTGQRVTVRGTPYDFSSQGPRALGDQYLDDSFSALERKPDGSTITELIDPAAKYGLRVITLSSDIRSIQVYAPPTKNFVAIEPMFNFPDPYNRNWGSVNTGMLLLQPGQSAVWRVRLELFVPKPDHQGKP